MNSIKEVTFDYGMDIAVKIYFNVFKAYSDWLRNFNFYS